MKISRQTAMEVFGLNNDYTHEELNQKFKNLCKIVHPDTGGDENLFKFVMCCKEELLSNNTNEILEFKSANQATPVEKEQVDVNLGRLYEIYPRLHYYTKIYDIHDIFTMAKIYISPLKNKEDIYCFEASAEQSFSEFQKLGFATFSSTVLIPKKFFKFKCFNVRVEFLGQSFKFKISKRKFHHSVKLHNFFRFNSILELTFKKQNEPI